MPASPSKAPKSALHPRNKNRERYDLAALLKVKPELATFVKLNKFGNESIDFAKAAAVKHLNQAILKHYYGIEYWDFPVQNLCPPIPGRADYLHHIADLLAQSNAGKIPKGPHIRALDIGVGASAIYPIIGITEYGWDFIGSDIDPKSIASAAKIVDANPSLQTKLDLRLQSKPQQIFQGIIQKEEKIDFSICNPPFHASVEEAQKGSRRKIKNLSGKKGGKLKLNFSGIKHELIYKGGEASFIQNMIQESISFAQNCFWFSTLVSKESNLKGIYKSLNAHRVAQIETIPMSTGNKTSRIVAWTFLSVSEQKKWRKTRWESVLRSRGND